MPAEYSTYFPPPQLPPRPPAGTSNNPFRSPASTGQFPRHVSPEEQDESEELERALALSRQTGGGGNDDDSDPSGSCADGSGIGRVGDDPDGRGRSRERSVRASAPPPSPRRIDEEGEISIVGPAAFGPSNKDDHDGALAMVPVRLRGAAGADAQVGAGQPNKEDEDMQKAIQQSIMTASLHSITPFDIPDPMPRRPGA